MNPSDCLPENKSLGDKQDPGIVNQPDEAHAAINEFLSLLSHELRTPLAGTMGMLDLVLAGDLAADQRSALTLANASARAMLRMVEDMHDLARIETGRFALESSPFEVRPWADEMVQEIASAGRVNFSVEVDEQVPEILVGDGDRIAHLVMGQVDLFLKHNRSQNLCLTLTLETQASGDYLLVTIGETGAMLAESERVDLLQCCGKLTHVPLLTFRQIGLKQAVVSNLAASLGGALWPAQESVDRNIQALAVPIQLPAGYDRVGVEPQVAEELLYNEGDASQAHILLVEDDDAIRRLVELLLQQRGWRVTAVADGLHALEVLQNNQFDLVLMDIRMPRLDGLETTRRIRRREQSLGMSPLPIVGMTAHAAMQDRTMCLEAGMDDHLSKPIASNRLYAMVEKYLAG
ncbi:MAG: response regulator [Pedobacter sp.]